LRIEAKPFFLPEADRQSIIDRAQQSARASGISDAAWDRWRKGYGLGRDLLMISDPDGEAKRIRNARQDCR